MKLLSLVIVGCSFSGPALGQYCPQSTTSSSATIGDGVGFSVALSGNRLVAGSPESDAFGFGSGIAYAFERQSGAWLETQSVVAAQTNGADSFGRALALDGDRLLAGAPLVGPNQGRAYVFDFAAGSWTQTVELESSDGGFPDYFGGAVALDGDRALIGASFYAGSVGRAYVFELQPGGWTETQILPAPNVPAAFGRSVALDGDWALIGAPVLPSVFVYQLQAGTWVQVQELTGSQGDGLFGQDVALQGDRAVIGAPDSDTAYVFERTGSSWMETAVLMPADGSTGQLGTSVSLDGDRSVVGAPEDGSGSAHVFQLISGTWTSIARLEEPSAASNGFGQDVVIDGSTVAVGVPFASDGRGRMRLFELSTAATPFCFCAASGPCGNDDPTAGCANSTGEGAILDACGSGSVAAGDLSLTVTNAPLFEPIILFMGGGAIDQPFQDGRRCVGAGGAGVFRLNPMMTPSSGNNGILSYPSSGVPDVFALATSSNSGPLSAGETWYFQAFYRDPGGPCASSANLTNALEITLVP